LSKSKHPLRKYDVISISQDGGWFGWILLPVSYLLMLLPSEGKSLLANQILSRYINWRLRYNYFRFRNTNVRHIGILFPISVTTSSSSICMLSGYRNCPNRSTHCGNMTSYPFLKMAAATAKYYFRFRNCWCNCLQKVKVYQQTKFRRDISIGGCNIVTSCFKIQTSPYWNSTSGFDLDHFT